MSGRAGIYVHLPYCASRCGYCAFTVTTDASSRSRYLEALETEAALLSAEAAGASFDSVYLGGGTPSLLPPESIGRLLEVLHERFRIDAGAERTLEANPEDVSPAAVSAWIAAGVNRVSVGVQSLEDGELAAVGRRHDAARALAALQTLASSGLAVSGDLILGLPDQTADTFRRSVAGLCDAGVSHVSVYLLETEKRREIEEDRQEHPERYLSEDRQADLWLEMGATLAGRGLHHYEISNWSRPGSQALHNVKYWTRAPTLGLGISAHELWGGRRRANASHLESYVEQLGRGKRPLASDRAVSAEEAGREEVFLGLRLAEGVPETALEALMGRSEDARLRDDCASWIAEGILERERGRVRFTERGFLISNEVLSRLV